MNFLLKLFLILIGLIITIVILFAISLRERRPQIYFATENGDTNTIEQYLTSGSNVNEMIVCYPFGHRYAPLLDIAVEYGQLNAVKFLLKKGANLNLADSNGNTPLIQATWNVEKMGETNLEILKTLLNAGADPNLKASSEYGWTPLISAAELGQSEMVSILLTAGADVNATNNIGQTALHLAGNAEVAKLLISAGADSAIRAVDGTTPTDMAIRNHRFDVLKVLTNNFVGLKNSSLPKK